MIKEDPLVTNVVNKEGLEKLANLYEVLVRVFTETPVGDLAYKLSSGEQSLLRAILKRKYKTLDYADDLSIGIEGFLKKVEAESSRKRPEENQKFMFKFALKQMKRQLQKKSKKRLRKKDLEAFFLATYFGETSARLKVPLALFGKPSDSQKRSSPNFAVPKTINNQFVSLVSKSALFVEAFQSYLDNQFSQDYRKVIEFKLAFLLKRWEEKLAVSSVPAQTFSEVCRYVERNKKCKLPWNFVEIEEAKESLAALMGDNGC